MSDLVIPYYFFLAYDLHVHYIELKSNNKFLLLAPKNSLKLNRKPTLYYIE